MLVAWRNKWATILRLLAPLVFLTLALMVQEGLQANTRRTGRTRATPVSTPQRIASIPDCSLDLFINDKPCLNFVFTPFKNEVVRVRLGACLLPLEPAALGACCSSFADNIQLTVRQQLMCKQPALRFFASAVTAPAMQTTLLFKLLQTIVAAVLENNDPPIPFDRVSFSAPKHEQPRQLLLNSICPAIIRLL